MSWVSKQLNSTHLGLLNQIWHPVNDVFKGPSNFFDKYAHMWDVGGRNDKFWPAFATVGGALAAGSSLWGSGAGASGAGKGTGWEKYAKYARLAQMSPMGGAGAQPAPTTMDWTAPQQQNIPKTAQQILAEALAKQQEQYG